METITELSDRRVRSRYLRTVPVGGGSEDFAVDVLDHDDEFVVTVDVAGFERNERDVRVSDQRLWIEAE